MAAAKSKKAGDAEAAEAEAAACQVHDLPVPPDGGWGWVIVMSSFLCNLIVDGIAYTFGVFLPTFVIYFGVGKGTVSWVGSLLAGVYLSCGPIVSAITNKFGCRTTCIMGSVIGCLAFALSTLSNSVTMLMITYGILGGIGFGLVYLPAIVSVGYYFEKKRAFATGIAVCGSGFGTFVFAPLAQLLLDNFDWKGANLILAGLILNCAVFGSFMRPLVAAKRPNKPLLQRMAEDKAMQMERGSMAGSSYCMADAAGSTLATISEANGGAEASGSPGKDHKDVHNAMLKENLDDIEPKESDKLVDQSEAVSVKRRSAASIGTGSKDDLAKDLSRPLARKDVFYSGSVTNLREYQSQKSIASYRQSIVSIPKTTQTPEQDQEEGGCCTCIPAATRKQISGLMDFSLMKDPVFLFIGVSNIFGMLGFYVPYVYIIDAASTKGIDPDTGSFLLSVIGITNTVGRVISGWLSDYPFVDSLFVTNVCILVSGFAVACVPFCNDYMSFCITSGVFGLFSSAFIALTSIVLVDLLGIQQLTNAFGLLCLLRGVAAIAGPPLAGSVFDMTQSYDVPFWLAGLFLLISAAISFMVPLVRRVIQRRQVAADQITEMSAIKSGDRPTKV